MITLFRSHIGILKAKFRFPVAFLRKQCTGDKIGTNSDVTPVLALRSKATGPEGKIVHERSECLSWNTIFSHKDAQEFIAKQLGQLLSKVEVVGTLNKILRFELPCEPLNLLNWLNNQRLEHKFYWSSRESDLEVAGVGLADCIKGNGDVDFKQIFEHIEERLSERNPHLRYYGGIEFNSRAYHFFIPRFEVLRVGEEWLFALNISFEDIKEFEIKRTLEELQNLNFTSQELPSEMPQNMGQKSDPERQEWEKIFNQAKQYIEERTLQKIVLARKTTYEFAGPLNPWIILNSLKEKTPQCFHFCLMPDSQTAFLGASPERLYRREGVNLETEALAGTKSRGENTFEDEQRGKDLLSSPKDKQEHFFVVKFINETLQKICSCVNQDKGPKLLKQNAGYHLLTGFQGILNLNVDDAAILSVLHPTPAVGGYPQENALRLIQELEPFERGWYAGAMGFVGQETAEFCVAIRSGVISDNKLSLFAGAGIVSESTADEEWEEIEAKIRSFGI